MKSKLSRKLLGQVTLALCVVFVLSFAVYTYFMPQFYLQQKKLKLADLTSQLVGKNYNQALETSERLAEQYKVTIVSARLGGTTDSVNEKLKFNLDLQGVKLTKFWLTEDKLAILRSGGHVHNLYDQNKLKSSYLVNFLPVDGYVFAIGESIAHSEETMEIVKQFHAYTWIGAFLLLIGLSVLYTWQIVKPLAKLNEAAEQIADLHFTKVDIHTKDEIESLAQSLNRMSDHLEEAYLSLEQQNANLRQFITDISHELKTPLALIQLYASGMKDGLDNGTYVDVIAKQSQEMEMMIARLLELSRLEVDQYKFERIDFNKLVQNLLDTYHEVFLQQGRTLEMNGCLEEQSLVMADQTKLISVLQNFFMNALKYARSSWVKIEVEPVDWIAEPTPRSLGTSADMPVLELTQSPAKGIRFAMTNEVDVSDVSKWDLVWEPFYVLESSRSKKLSGTGLGLSIARTILQKHQAQYGMTLKEGTVQFYFVLPLLQK